MKNNCASSRLFTKISLLICTVSPIKSLRPSVKPKPFVLIHGPSLSAVLGLTTVQFAATLPRLSGDIYMAVYLQIIRENVVKIMVMWEATSCRLVGGYCRLGWAYYFHLQDKRVECRFQPNTSSHLPY